MLSNIVKPQLENNQTSSKQYRVQTEIFHMRLFGFQGTNSVDVEAYEKELVQLATRARKTQLRIDALKRYRSNFRRKTLFYMALSYVLLLLVIIYQLKHRYATALSSLVYLTQLSRMQAVVVFGWPLITIILSYSASKSFTVLIHRQERLLGYTLKTREKKIEELKNKTKFDATESLIRKYNGINLGEQDPSTEEEIKSSHQAVLKPNEMLKKVPPAFNPGVNKENGRKSFQDRILDLIIGSDHNESVEDRYALICERCFTHNGLAPPGSKDPSKVLYICRRCGYFNNSTSHNSKTDVEQCLTAEDASKRSLEILTKSPESSYVDKVLDHEL